jgi:putative selenate reductase
MQPPFRPAPLRTLARWVFRELDARGTVLGLPPQNFQVPDPRFRSVLFGRTLAAPLGVAAGPHTQLAQNIVAAWLCGARFIELKTVQVLDEIHVPRPCIDAADETYNCEWSQELKLPQSFTEYLNAWVLLHALAHRLGLGAPGALFAMSVGYDFAGIQSAAVQRFIASMRDARAALPQAVDAVAEVYPAIRDLEIPAEISNHVTLSTMHGCPPEEIERIARHLLVDVGLHTWVKLNPTLLGPEALRALLGRTRGSDVEVPDSALEHDPRFPDAMAMARRLATAAAQGPTTFGLKLSNTLEVTNGRAVFPPSEKTMYLSGRALHPLTLALAQRIAEALDGAVSLSFCGGADAQSFVDLVADGLAPVTVCSDLLEPGGYARLQQYLLELEAAFDGSGADTLAQLIEERGGARAHLAAHAERAALDPRYARRERPLSFKGPRALGPFDCIAAPCLEACPAHQNVPDYLWHLARGRSSEALATIERTNPLPAVTGEVCDHPCTDACVRSFYDAPLAIRELKRFAVEHGVRERAGPAAPGGPKVAVVGAGPAGLAAAQLLLRLGFAVTVFEARLELGGLLSSAIPRFRLSPHALEADLASLRSLGIELRMGAALGAAVGAVELRESHDYLFLGLGAQAGKKLGIPGEDSLGVIDALDFLERARRREPPPLGRRVLVVGGGNSAMDAARVARRLLPSGSVDLVYRRTRAQMPADPDEVRACLREGVRLRELLAPTRVLAENQKVEGLVCQPMALGAPDASGRPRPVPVSDLEVRLPADAILTALGQVPVLDALAELHLAKNRDGTLRVDPATGETSAPGVFAGGDLVRGPSSIIQAIADGRAAAQAIARRAGVAPMEEPALDKGKSRLSLLSRKGHASQPQSVAIPRFPRRRDGVEAPLGFRPGPAALEASRCLDCDELCSLCVTVCPNRALVAYLATPRRMSLPVLVAAGDALVRAGSSPFAVEQQVQIALLGDFCNGCGNCATFCPTAGAPYRNKPRFWLDRDGFEQALGDAFFLEPLAGSLRLEARIGGARQALERWDGRAEYRGTGVIALFETQGWSLIEARPSGPVAPGERFDLGGVGLLVALLDAADAVPVG